MLGEFQMILRQGSGGPQHHLAGDHLLGEPPQEDEQIILYVPVQNVGRYYRAVLANGAEVLTGILPATPYLDHGFEGFYAEDFDHNCLCFYNDHHGPYSGEFWNWCWEPRLTEEKVREYEQTAHRRKDQTLCGVIKKAFGGP